VRAGGEGLRSGVFLEKNSMNPQHSFFLLATVLRSREQAELSAHGSAEPGSTAARQLAPALRGPVADPRAIVEFWREAGPELWFAKDPDFDARFRARFLALHETAARGELEHWLRTADGALALVLLLDQFPRNAFRGTPRMYETDAMARRVADVAIAAGHDRSVEAPMQFFFYLPLGHSEQLADQERALELCRRLGEPTLSHAQGHRDIVRRFGRFPHRNAILGRTPLPEEERFLAEGGFPG